MKTNLLMRLLIAALFFACVSSSAKAQTTPDVLEGLTPYQSFNGGDFDSINLSNGNVLLRMPLIDYPQRGGALKLGFTFVENTKVAAEVQKCFGSSGCEYLWYGYVATESSVPVVFDQVVDDQAAGVVRSTFYLPHNPSEFAEYAAVTSEGAIHPLVEAGTESADATGFYANPTGTNQLTAPTLLINREGIRFSLTSPNNTREDSNGNQILPALGGVRTSYTDTIGRVIPSPQGTATTNFSGCPSGGSLLPVVSASLWTVPGPNNGTVTFEFCNVTVNINIPDNEPSPVKGTSGPVTLTQSIVLPNGTAWNFEYNDRNPGDPSSVNFGIPTQITLPTGGTITYVYTTIEAANATPSWSRWVASRTVDANDGTGAHTWSYAYAGVGGLTPTTTVTDPLGNNTVHTFEGTSGVFETETQYYQLINGVQTLLKTVNTDYTFLGDNYSYQIPSVVPKSVTTTWPNNQVSQIQTDYDSQQTPQGEMWSYGNMIAKREYDYGTGAPGPLLRTTTTQYEAFVNSNYLTNNLMSLPSSVKITDGGGTQRANTTYGYDEYALQTSGLGSSQQLDLNPPDGVYRGNQTSVHRWLSGSATATTNCNISVSNGYLVSYTTYNNSGTRYNSTDSCGSAAGDSKHTTKYLYSNSSPYEGAYPTTITNPLGQSTITTYDSNIGRLASTKDPNLQTTSFTYDNMWRLATVTYPDGGSATITHQETTFPFTATLTKKITSSLNYVMTNTFDGVGRVSESLVTDLQGNIKTDTTYDADGRKYTVSNPYRTTTDSTYGITSYVYDALGRTCVVVPPDGTAVANTSCPATQPSNDVFTIYSGSSTTVTDQQGKSRESQTDGLGRLTNVWEDPAVLNYHTVYTYDALGDLTTVVQGGSHNRSFIFDSLKRLTSSTNPETGTTPVTYTYDADSNVITKKDARTFIITYGYDILNRITGKTYSNGDPAVSYSYDQTGCLSLSACYNIGRRTAMTDVGGSETWAYDQMGRELAEQRITNSITKSTGYTYNLDGSLATLIYPSGRTITYTTDSTERPSEAQDVANGINYAMGSCPNGANSNGTCYAPQGAASQTQNGANLISTLYYDKRLQPCRISVKSSGTAPTSCSDTTNIGNVIDYTYSFGLGTTDNGNVMGITNNGDNTRSQSFTYDHLNRIVTAETASTHATSPANCWGESYTYDQWANLTTIGVASSSYNGCTQESLSVTALSNNQLSATGFSYDASGNILTDGHNTYGWNAESEIKSAGGVNYTYDGDGDRIEKSNGKIYWYGAGTEILDESDLSGNITDEYIFFGGKRIGRRDSSGNVVYYAADHLGTSRVVASSTGSILDQSDFYPYGGERVLTSSSGNTYKFEGKERDTETNNDDFGARYYASQFGRWTSPDWSAAVAPVPYANLTNPQTLNLYAMVSDNPETFADLDGHEYASVPQADGASISFDYSPDAGQQEAAAQQAAKNNPANSQPAAQDQTQQNSKPDPSQKDTNKSEPSGSGAPGKLPPAADPALNAAKQQTNPPKPPEGGSPSTRPVTETPPKIEGVKPWSKMTADEKAFIIVEALLKIFSRSPSLILKVTTECQDNPHGCA